MNMSEFDRAGVVPKRIAVIGGGIAGLASAWLLSRRHRVTLFEAGDYVGGHTNTIDIAVEGHRHPIDTGFLVFNDRTYPNLCALFACLGVASVESEMSFGVSLAEPEIEWAGSDLGTVFAQRSNLLRPAFLGMLSDILRFNRETTRMAAEGDAPPVSLGDYLAAGRYGSAFRDWYLLPMASAIWSCPTRTMLDYPLATFARFCHNHGLLQIFDRPRWRTVAGGGREYVRRILDELDDVQVATPVLGVDRRPDGVWLRCRDGAERFDEVVFACHSDQTLRISAGASRSAVLGAIRTAQPACCTPTLRSCRAAARCGRPELPGWRRPPTNAVSVSYLINRLQPLPFETPVVVSLNPFTEPARDKLIRRIEYAHPVFDQAAVDAQAALPTIQGRQRSWFAGAWTGYGFHEDGLKSALVVARALGAEIPWQPSAEAAPASLLREAA
jgi:predicted NAD/FAD-binding protein